MTFFSKDIRDYLTCDLKLSDTAFNDLFSEFDLPSNDFEYFNTSTNTNVYSQQSTQVPVDLPPPPPYDAALFTTAVTNIAQPQNSQPNIDDYLSTNALKSLLEHHQNPQPIVKNSFSPPPTVPTAQPNYTEVIKNEKALIDLYFFLYCSHWQSCQ